MKKFIIDIPDSTIWIDVPQSSMKNGLITFTTKSIPVEKLTPYAEPDCKAIEDEVWEFARRIICPSDCCEDSISAHTKEIFNKEGWEIRGIFNDLSYQEAKAKFEEWLKQKDVIHVGDEVLNRLGKPYVIYEIKNNSAYGIMFDEYPLSQECFSIYDTNKKTGRHFDEVAELLEKMRENNNDKK